MAIDCKFDDCQNLVKQATSLAHSKAEKVKQATAQKLSSEALINFRQAALARMQSLGQRGSIQREKIEEAGYELAAARAQKIAVEADIKAAQAEALAAVLEAVARREFRRLGHKLEGGGRRPLGGGGIIINIA